MADALSQTWIRTASGKVFDLVDPTPEMFDIEDIAHALSHICRFTGHTRHFYSVAQHSVAVSMLTDSLEGLLHDATEAYIGDVSRPLKRLPDMWGYKAVETRLYGALARWAGIPEDQSPGVKVADNTLLATEMRDLMVGSNWLHLPEPLKPHIRPWPSVEAYSRFLQRYNTLLKRRESEGSLTAR